MNNSVYMNRELSWLKFNERVLEEAESRKCAVVRTIVFCLYLPDESGRIFYGQSGVSCGSDDAVKGS